MKFTTASGTKYTLEHLEDEVDGIYFYSGVVTREGVPIVHVMTGEDMEDLPSARVYFDYLPTIGESFVYDTPSHNRVYSTPVTEVRDA